MLVNGATLEVKKPDGSTGTKTIPPAVRGWDDPRLYSLVAIRRRGVPAGALVQFVSELGVTDANTVIRTYKFESTVRKYLERTVPRVMLVLEPIKITIEDIPDDFSEDAKVPYDPKNPEGESRIITATKTLYIDRSDFREVDSAEFFRLAPGKTVGLQNFPFYIKATSFEKDSNGKVSHIKAVKVAPEGNDRPKAFIHWVGASAIPVEARQYNALFNAEEPNSLDWKNGGYAESLNPDSEVIFKDALIEPAFGELRKGHAAHPSLGSDDIVRFQAVRTGYFAIDPVGEEGKVVLNQIVTLKEDAGKGK